MAKEVHQIDQRLVENLATAEKNMEIAKKALIEAQLAVYEAGKASLPERGTTHFEGVKIVTAQSEKWSDEQLAEIEPTWPSVSNLPFPFKKTYKADGKAITYIRENAKTAYDILSVALTVTDKKPTFELTGKE